MTAFQGVHSRKRNAVIFNRLSLGFKGRAGDAVLLVRGAIEWNETYSRKKQRAMLIGKQVSAEFFSRGG